MNAGPADPGAAARARMVAEQIARRGLRSPAVLAAMRAVPRERFVGADQAPLAHADGPLPIGCGQTISQPYIVALMAEAAAIGPGDTVLEVGAGSGYAAAVLAQLAARVCAIERHPALAAAARERLAALGLRHVDLRAGDGTLGWPEPLAFDAIVVSAGGPAVPAALLAQLAPGGRLVMPVGDSPGRQRLVKLVRTAAGGFERSDLGGVAFVPLVGADGWGEDADRADVSPARSSAPG